MRGIFPDGTPLAGIRHLKTFDLFKPAQPRPNFFNLPLGLDAACRHFHDAVNFGGGGGKVRASGQHH